MKLYPSIHNVEASEQITVNKLPLAAITSVEKKTLPKINIADRFCHNDIESYVTPYSVYDSNKILFFKNNEEIDGSKYLKRNGSQYFFEPIDSMAFIPTEFTYSVTVEKKDCFKNNINYRLKIGCTDILMANMLTAIFSNASERKLCPDNIIINDKDVSPDEMINMSFNDADFLFSNQLPLEEELESYLDSNISVWLSLDEEKLNDAIIDSNTSKYTLREPVIYARSNYELEKYSKKDGSSIQFDLNKEITICPKEKFEYINIFSAECPILICKKNSKGFVIISHKSLIENADSCIELIYEIIFTTYLNSYFSTKTKTSFITKELIDYYININKRFNKNHIDINLKNLLYESGYNTDIDYVINKINVSETAKYVGQNKYGNLLFEKISGIEEPTKNNNDIFVFTTKGNVINYKQDINTLKIKEDGLKLSILEINDEFYLKIEAFKSSSEYMNLPEQTLIIPDTAENNLIYDKENNKFALIKKSLYDISKHGIWFAEIKINYDTILSCADIRITGGGENSSNPNYEMIDTGNIKGRPYRIGNTLVIKLPIRFKNQEKIIKEELEKHTTSGSHIILIFEEQ